MNALSEYLNLGLGALFLQPETYARMREDSRRITKGLLFIVLVGVAVAAVAVVGTVLEWSTTPDLSNLKNIVLQEMQRTVWFREMSRTPQALQGFRQTYDLVWQFMAPMFSVNVLGSVVGIITNPIALLLRWLIYGVFAFLFARLLGGKGNLSQTLGCTALAAAPEMLGIVNFFPYVELGGLTVWGLLCAYLGIKVSNELTPWRAFAATLLPLILFGLLMLLFSCIGFAALGALFSSGGAR